MVTRSRAQLILAGSVLLAFVIIGLAVVVNTGLFAENVPAGGTGGHIDDAAEYDRNARGHARSTVLRVNHRSRNLTASELGGAVSRNVSLYGSLLGESYGTEGPISVNLTYHNDSSAFGARIVQLDNDPVTDETASADWSLVPASERRDVGWFLLNVDAAQTDTDTGSIVVSDGTETLNFSINRSATSDRNVTVRANATFASNETVTCQATDNRILLDLLEGSSLTSDCSFHGINEMQPPYSVRVENGDAINASYELVVNESVPSPAGYDACHTGVSIRNPCAAPAVWVANVTTNYTSGPVTLTTRDNVTIYPNDSQIATGTVTGILENGSTLVVSDGAVEGNESSVLGLGIENAEALGSTADVDGDGKQEMPYVDSSGDLKLNDTDGEEQTLVSVSDGSDTDPDSEKTLMTTGQWNGSDTSVFYANESATGVYRVRPGESPTQVAHMDSNGVDAVHAIGDIDGDGTDELIYADSSQEVRYLEPDGTKKTTGVTAGSGSNGGIGSGYIWDYDNDGTDETLIVDGSDNIEFVDSDGTDEEIISISSTAPLTVADVDGDGTNEIVFVAGGESNNPVRYVDDVAGSPTIKDLVNESGDVLTANPDTGAVS